MHGFELKDPLFHDIAERKGYFSAFLTNETA